MADFRSRNVLVLTVQVGMAAAPLTSVQRRLTASSQRPVPLLEPSDCAVPPTNIGARRRLVNRRLAEPARCNARHAVCSERISA